MKVEIMVALVTLIIAGTALLGATEVVQNIIETSSEDNASKTKVKRWVIEVKDANASKKAVSPQQEKSVY